jgi:type II secretion system protein F
MTQYSFRATDRNGQQQTGVLDAANEAAVIQKLREQNLLPISINATRESRSTRSFKFKMALFKRASRRDVLEFTSKLSTLADAGIQLDRCLAISAELTESDRMREIVKEVRRNVQGGSSFGDALGRHPKVFSRLYVNMVKSGEAGGVLEVILQRLSGFLESSQLIRDEIVSASIYPAILISVGSIVVAFMVTFVLPKFTLIFTNMGADLPTPTKILVNLVTFLKSSWIFVLVGIVLIAAALRQYIKTEDGRMTWDRLKLKMPMIGALVQKIEIARFARTLGTLVRSGVPILQALAIVKETLTNRVISSSLLAVYGRLKEGGGLANPLKDAGCFPPLAIHMIAVGEETGSFETMLLKVADTYENDVRVSIKRVMGIIEPALILVMGIVVGFIVVSMLLAVFSISDMPI